MFNSEAQQGNLAKLLHALKFFPKGRCRRGWGAGEQTTDKEADSKTENCRFSACQINNLFVT